MQIKSYWQKETAKWDGKTFIDRKKSDIEEKELKVTLDTTDHKDGYGPVVRFHGGPTGFESYYLNNLLSIKWDNEDFCICGGTVNSWPRCWVKSKDIYNILEVFKDALRC